LRGFSARQHVQKPNKKYVSDPKADFRKTGMSPNTAEGKERLGLKDLEKLISDKREKPEIKEKTDAREESQSKRNSRSRKKGKNTNSEKGRVNDSPVNSPVAPKAPATASKTITPVIEYQEKSATPVNTTERSIDLSQVVKDPGRFAGQDNSMDGFLSIRH
jgi:hypothetical protein